MPHKLSRKIAAHSCALAGVLLFCCAPHLAAQQTQQQTAPIRLTVDETAVQQKIVRAQFVIPAHPGPLTLYYPEWIPGEHAPDGPINNLVGLKFFAAGKRIPWRRDLVDMFAFHLTVPAGVSEINGELAFLLSAPASGFSGGASATSQLAVLSWNQVLLYPQGRTARDIMFQPSLRLPAGWKFGTALPIASQSANAIDFAPVSLETLVDSPVLAGARFRKIDLTPGENPAHEMDIAADSDEALNMSPATLMHLKQLIAESGALWGARHYRDYHFLLTLSDDVAHFGLEHHESSDDRVPERTLADDALRMVHGDLLPHEFTHSWNGKYRRPADLATPDYQQPMRDDLLWVYEGLTEYFGDILAARSGLWTLQQFHEHLAYVAATYDYRFGRTWRSLQDTADAAQLLYFAPVDWTAWRRSTDYYDEGLLLWLEVDTLMRNQSHGHHSLNEFCRAFHGEPGGAPALKTYTYEDVIAGLNAVVPNDWNTFLTQRLTSTEPPAPLGGITNGGWTLVYDDVPNEAQTAEESTGKELDLTFSIGVELDSDGVIHDVIPGRPAAAAGIGPDMRIAAVNGRQFSPDALRDAVAATKTGAPLELLCGNGQYFQTYRLSYHAGMRYPHLVREASHADILDEIIKPLAKPVR